MEKPQFSSENLELLNKAFHQQLEHCDYVVVSYSKSFYGKNDSRVHESCSKCEKFVAVDPGEASPLSSIKELLY